MAFGGHTVACPKGTLREIVLVPGEDSAGRQPRVSASDHRAPPASGRLPFTLARPPVWAGDGGCRVPGCSSTASGSSPWPRFCGSRFLFAAGPTGLGAWRGEEGIREDAQIWCHLLREVWGKRARSQRRGGLKAGHVEDTLRRQASSRPGEGWGSRRGSGGRGSGLGGVTTVWKGAS